MDRASTFSSGAATEDLCEPESKTDGLGSEFEVPVPLLRDPSSLPMAGRERSATHDVNGETMCDEISRAPLFWVTGGGILRQRVLVASDCLLLFESTNVTFAPDDRDRERVRRYRVFMFF